MEFYFMVSSQDSNLSPTSTIFGLGIYEINWVQRGDNSTVERVQHDSSSRYHDKLNVLTRTHHKKSKIDSYRDEESDHKPLGH